MFSPFGCVLNSSQLLVFKRGVVAALRETAFYEQVALQVSLWYAGVSFGGGVPMEKEHFEVVLESIESKVQQVLECFSVLDKKIDDVRDELKHDNGILNVKITAVSDRLDRVEANLTNRIDAVDDKLTKRIDAVEDKLTKRIDAVDEKLTKRIDAVDEKLTKRIDAVHTELIAHRENVELHKVPRRRVLKQV